MKFHDAIKKHIKVLDSIQKIRTRDEIFPDLEKAIKDAKMLKEELGGTWVILNIGRRGYLVDRKENIHEDEKKQIVKEI